MKRILILGSAGAGKTTLARYLSKQLALPLIHLDQEFWRPGWVAPPVESWRQQIIQITAQPTWIMDGYYRNTLDVTCRAADTLIFLDMARFLCIYRVCVRYFSYILLHQVRMDLPEGCPERLRWSFLCWVWTFPQKQRPIILAQLQQAADGRHILVIHSQAELVQVYNWLSYSSQRTSSSVNSD